jgi:hypothetical protein
VKVAKSSGCALMRVGKWGGTKSTTMQVQPSATNTSSATNATAFRTCDTIKWRLGFDGWWCAGLILLWKQRLQKHKDEFGQHFKYMGDATPYLLGQEAYQDLISGAAPKFLEALGLDGLPVVQINTFQVPAPLKIVSTAASKDGRVLVKSVESTSDLFGLVAEDYDRFESDKGGNNLVCVEFASLCVEFAFLCVEFTFLCVEFTCASGVENSGNSFDDGLGKGGLHYLYFHPAGADWGPCKAHGKQNKARKYACR